jgi:EpsD family peptidyl-prolyl cis-trans isomerase
LLYRRSAATHTPPEAAAARRRAILDQLVRAELMAQRAVAEGLDTHPDLKVEARLQRRQALAQLFEAKAIKRIPGASPEMVRQTIADNPLTFAQRHLIEFDQVQLAPADPALLKQLNAEAAKGVSLERLIELAQQAKAGTRRVLRKHSSESIPPVLAKALLDSKPGQPIVVLLDERSGALLAMRSITPKPLVGQAAEKAAAVLLNRQRNRTGLAGFTRHMVETASINYYGEFAATAQARTDSAPNEATDLATGLQALGLVPHAMPLRGIPMALTAASTMLVLASVMLAVLLLVTSLRWTRGEFWLPRLCFWRPPEPAMMPAVTVNAPASDEEAGETELPGERLQDEERAGLVGHLFLLIWTGSCLALLGWQLHMGWQRLPWWALSAALLAGLLLGSATSHVFAQSSLRLWQRQRIWWQPVLFGSLLLVNAFTGGLLAALR